MHILMTGDYWEPEFQPLLRSLRFPVTMIPFEKLQGLVEPSQSQSEVLDGLDPSLVVLAASRRDAFSFSAVEALRASIGTTPIVALLGSWCEGEMRSGEPWPGLPRVYWHQWNYRFAEFVKANQQQVAHPWMLPPTSNDADRVIAVTETIRTVQAVGVVDTPVAVSALTEIEFDLVRDALESSGLAGVWLESTQWEGLACPATECLCITADSWSVELERRADWARSILPGASTLLLLNIYRADETPEIRSAGIHHVLTKPFQLDEFQNAIQQVQSACEDTRGQRHDPARR